MNVDVLSGASRAEGGLFGAVLGLNQALLGQEVAVRLLSHIDEFTNEDLPAWAPIPVELYKARGPLLSSLAVRKLLRETNSDVLHVHGIWRDAQWAAHQARSKTGKPVVISPHGMLDPWAVKNSAWKKKLIGALFANESLRGASCLHALCDSEAESIRAYGLETPVAVIPNGIELPALGAPRVPGDRKRLLFLGRIHPKKGIDELLKGWAKTRPADWELVIAGWDDGGHEDGLKKLAADLGVANSVSFAGSKFGAEKEALLRSVDAFVLPSFSEGLPMSILEAWSYELPVIMTDFCNIPSGFEARAAARVEPNADSISSGLNDLAAMSDAERADMGARGRALVEARFTWDRVAADMRRVYEWCLGGDKPACIRTR